MTPGNIPAADWEVVKSVAARYDIDPYLLVAIGFAETGWFTKGLGLKGLGLGVGAYDSGATFKWVGVELQCERGCQILQRRGVRTIEDIRAGKLHADGRWENGRYVGPGGSVRWASADTADRGFPWSRNVIAVHRRITTAMPRPVLRRGATGDAVLLVQANLVRHGRTASMDGKFGLVTAQRVRSFQRARGLVVDGVVGPKTWGALDAPVVV